MNKIVYRFFFSFLDTQQRWLNKMAEKGYRLIDTTKVMYEFEPCNKKEYQYYIEFVGGKAFKEVNKYIEFLEEKGYRIIAKNINLNYSYGKARWRSWAKGKGQIATNPGRLNKELLIVEKKNDGKPFEQDTSMTDMVLYYKPLRKAYSSTAVLTLLAFALHYYTYGLFKVSTIVLLAVFVLVLWALIGYHKRIVKYLNLRKR